MRRIGSIKERRVDVRLLAATNRNLAEQVKTGRFREDLYYRINVMSLQLPPLRERVGDITLLLDHFLGSDWEMEDEARVALANYEWPGNVRELSNAVERAKILADGNLLRFGDFPREAIEHHSFELHEVGTQSDDLAAIERAKVVEVLRRESGNKTRAARALGIDRRKLYRLVEKYCIHSGEVTEAS
jgi:transcriptional regulator with PAS, ATPase and Fis domain